MKFKIMLPVIAALLTACASLKYHRMITRPDGSYKIIPCKEKELDLTVDGDTTRQNFDLVKYYNANEKRYSPFKYLP